DRRDHLLRLAHLEIERVHVGGENADIAFAEIFDQFGRVSQSRAAEERTNRLITKSNADGGNAVLDFVLALLLVQLRHIFMRALVRADGMAGSSDLFHDLRVPTRMLADRKEKRLGALVGQGLEYGRCMSGPRAVVERQDDFMVTQEIVSLEMLEAEAGSARGVDLDNAGNSEGIRIV